MELRLSVIKLNWSGDWLGGYKQEVGWQNQFFSSFDNLGFNANCACDCIDSWL